MNKSPFIVINKLLIEGIDKSYEAKFEEGLNIVWGDMDSGKSSILNCINYCLGGSNKELLYEEIVNKARTARLEVNLSGNIVTFERIILDAKAPIKAYTCSIDEIDGIYPKILDPSTSSEFDGWVSDYILDQLGIPKVKIKESNIRDDADSDRLSFRDLMKLLYLKQTKVGSDSIMDRGNHALFHKNVEIQKFLYNVNDERLSSLKTQLAEETKSLNILKSKKDYISNFIKEIGVSKSEDFNSTHKHIEESLEHISSELNEAKKNYEFTSETSLEMKKRILDMKSGLTDLQREKEKLSQKLDDYTKLKFSYVEDLANLDASRKAKAVLGELSRPQDMAPCPLCTTKITFDSECVSNEFIDHEIRSIKNRIIGCQSSIDEIRGHLETTCEEISTIASNIKKLSESFDRENIGSISPLVEVITTIEQQKSELLAKREITRKNYAIVHKFSEIQSSIENSNSKISRIKESIDDVEEGLTGLDPILSRLKKYSKRFITNSGLQKVRDISVDNSFVTYFRGMEYYSISSGGVRTILSISSYLSRLELTIRHPCYFPTFFMLDTPGQNIGRYKRADDDSEISDPTVYENIYAQLLNTIDLAQDKETKIQIIVVDNDFPDILAEHPEDYHLVKRFSKGNPKYEYGLINDA